jgi:hypothetical protein
MRAYHNRRRLLDDHLAGDFFKTAAGVDGGRSALAAGGLLPLTATTISAN